MKTTYFFLLAALFLGTSFAQFSKDDKELVRAGYERISNKNLIHQYLNSDDVKKVNAALLCIAGIGDTSLMTDIVKIDFNKNSEYICFALGQLGVSDISEAYLSKQLSTHPELSKYILPALSKTSKEIYNVPFVEGSPISLYNYHQRKIGVPEEIAGFLIKELQKNNDFYSAFALYRVGPPERSKEVLSTALNKSLDSKNKRSTPYLLGCFRKLKTFPEGKDVYNKILSIKDFDTRIEAVKLLAFYNHDGHTLKDYLTFFNDKNGNITRQAAISIADIKGNISIVLRFIEKMILDSALDDATKEELLLSYLKLSGASFSALQNKFSKKVSDKGFIQAAQLKADEESGAYLKSVYNNSSYRNKVTILSYQDSSYITQVTEQLKLSDPELTKTLNDSIKLPAADFDILWANAFKYRSAVLNTSKGKIKIKFLPAYAPVSVGNFCYLAAKGYFNNNIFHRVVPGFVIQTGDTTGTGWSGPGYSIKSEFSSLEYKKGIIGMASSGKDTEGSQWFITTGNYPHLDGRYSVFAEVLEGQSTAEATVQEDKIISIELIR